MRFLDILLAGANPSRMVWIPKSKKQNGKRQQILKKLGSDPEKVIGKQGRNAPKRSSNTWAARRKAAKEAGAKCQ